MIVECLHQACCTNEMAYPLHGMSLSVLHFGLNKVSLSDVIMLAARVVVPILAEQTAD